MKRLEILSIKVCQLLPFDMTFFEHNGLCTKEKSALNSCHYCEKINYQNYLCKKKTYTPPPPSLIAL